MESLAVAVAPVTVSEGAAEVESPGPPVNAAPLAVTIRSAMLPAFLLTRPVKPIAACRLMLAPSMSVWGRRKGHVVQGECRGGVHAGRIAGK